MTSARDDRKPRIRTTAPALFLVGLLTFALSLLLLGVLAAEGSTTPLDAARVDVGEETVLVSYPVPPYAPVHAVLDVSYRFPAAPGDAYLLTCADLERLVAGRPPLAAAVAETSTRSGSFSRPLDDYLGFGSFYFPLQPADARPAQPDAAAGTGGATGAAGTCVGAFVTFRWSAAQGEENRPEAHVQVREVPLDSGTAMLLFALAAAGGLTALAAGLHVGRRRAAPHAAPIEAGAGAAETLVRMAERAEAWLARTRRYLLVAGPLGIFLWYPVLIPWAWRTGRHASGASWMPWMLASGVLAVLLGLTVLWAREFVRLDRELAAWRAQMTELRRREEALMAELAR